MWQILLSAFIDSLMTLFLCTLPLHGIYFTSFPALEAALKFNKRADDRRSVTLGFWESSSDANDPLTPEAGILHPGRRAEGPSCLKAQPWARIPLFTFLRGSLQPPSGEGLGIVEADL